VRSYRNEVRGLLGGEIPSVQCYAERTDAAVKRPSPPRREQEESLPVGERDSRGSR
jgi:hypothetical protein